MSLLRNESGDIEFYKNQRTLVGRPRVGSGHHDVFDLLEVASTKRASREYRIMVTCVVQSAEYGGSRLP